MTNREKFLAGAIFKVGTSNEEFRLQPKNGEFSNDIIQVNVSSICYDFKDFCEVSHHSEKGFIYVISAFGKPHIEALLFENMIFHQENEMS